MNHDSDPYIIWGFGFIIAEGLVGNLETFWPCRIQQNMKGRKTELGSWNLLGICTS